MTSPFDEPLRDAFERAIYRRLKDHPALAGMFPLFTDAWLIAQHAAAAVIEYAAKAEAAPAAPNTGSEGR